MTGPVGPVVVGLDGSPASVTAAWWAADEAARRRLPLVLLHSWTTQPLNVPIPQEARSKQHYGRDVLRRAEAELLHRHPDLDLTTELVPEPAANALLERAADASVLVLGSRGHGSLAGFLLGSISLHVLGLASCPTVAVRAGDLAVEESWGNPVAAERDEVVVGVRGPEAAADPVLEFAFTAAQAYGVGVRAVRARAHEDRAEAEERALLGAALAPWREKFPDVPVVEQAVTGSAAQTLVAASARGRLTVIGRRRHTSPLTWKLGPVAHTVLHHAASPVAVVPHD